MQNTPQKRLEQIIQLDEKQAAAISETMDQARGSGMSAEQVARLIADFDRPEPPKTRSRVVPFDHLHHSSVQPQHQPLLQKAKQQPSFQPQPQDAAKAASRAGG